MTTSGIGTPFYADESFIRVQRIAAVALMVSSFVTKYFFMMGSVLMGCTLLQQAIASAKGCEHDKPSRVAAGILFLSAKPLCVSIGLLFWAFSHDANVSKPLQK